MTTAEYMAVAVLKGDMTAARALADLLCEDVKCGNVLPPIHKIPIDTKNLKIAVYFSLATIEQADIDRDSLRTAIDNWLAPDSDYGPLVLVAVDRIELYEIAHE